MNVYTKDRYVYINNISIPLEVFKTIQSTDKNHINYDMYTLDKIGNNVYLEDGKNRVKMTVSQLKSIKSF